VWSKITFLSKFTLFLTVPLWARFPNIPLCQFRQGHNEADRHQCRNMGVEQKEILEMMAPWPPVEISSKSYSSCMQETLWRHSQLYYNLKHFHDIVNDVF
jgi:hypothetical protein